VSIVTNEELVDVTGGLQQGAAQARWIKRWFGFDPPIKADGHPLLTWDQVNRTKADAPAPRTQPKWKNAA
jgi:hypothetical protein